MAKPFERGDHVEIADRLVEQLGASSPVVHADGHFLKYSATKGIFEEVPAARVSTVVQAFAGADVQVGTKTTKLRLRAADVHGATKLGADKISEPEFFEAARPGVAFTNGFVEVRSDAIEKKAHSPENRCRFAYGFDFQEAAQPDRLMEFFSEIFREDSEDDRAQKVALIQEYLGGCLLGLATRFQRALVLVGDGANGKGVLSSVMERCMPPGSVSAIPPQDLGQEYRRAMLAGKLLNIVSELPESDIMDSESWKAVVAGDTCTGREIRKEPFLFKPRAGHVYSANRLPGTADQSHGFWRRLLVVKFTRVFRENEQNPTLADEIVKREASAVVSWALAGAQRLLTNGRYTTPDSAAEALDEWKRAADQVRAFVEEKTERLPMDVRVTGGVTGEALYRGFKDWAQENGHRAMASNKFSERMRLLGLQAARTNSARFYPVKWRQG